MSSINQIPQLQNDVQMNRVRKTRSEMYVIRLNKFKQELQDQQIVMMDKITKIANAKNNTQKNRATKAADKAVDKYNKIDNRITNQQSKIDIQNAKSLNKLLENKIQTRKRRQTKPKTVERQQSELITGNTIQIQVGRTETAYGELTKCIKRARQDFQDDVRLEIKPKAQEYRHKRIVLDINVGASIHSIIKELQRVGQIDSENSMLQSGFSIKLTPFKPLPIQRNIKKQIMREGQINCLVSCCIEQIQQRIDGSESEEVVKKLKPRIKKLQKYLNIQGADSETIQQICTDAQISIQIDNIVGITTDIYTPNGKRSYSKCYLTNVYFNHVEGTVKATIKLKSQQQLDELKDTLTQENKSFQYEYNRRKELKSIFYSGTQHIIDTKTDFQDMINENTEELKKHRAYLSKDQYSYLSMFNQSNQQQNYKNLSKKTLEQFKQLYNYDQTKAYTQFHRNKWYCGLPTSLSVFMKLDQQPITFVTEGNRMGFFRCRIVNQIKNRQLKMLGYDKMYNTYTGQDYVNLITPEIKALTELGVQLQLIDGMFSLFSYEFRFNKEMEKSWIIDGDKMIPYAIFTGQTNITREEYRKFQFHIQNGDQNIASLITTKYEERWGECLELRQEENSQNFQCLVPRKSYQYTSNPFGIYIVVYQRLNLLQQLLKLNDKQLNSIHRIAVDGIYTNMELPEDALINGYRLKENEYKSDQYKTATSNYITYTHPDIIYDHNDVPEFVDIDESKCITGCGGSGKTTNILRMRQLIGQVVFVAHSNNLADNKQEEVKSNKVGYKYDLLEREEEYQNRIKFFNYTTIYNEVCYSKWLESNIPTVIICDEISTQTGDHIESLMNKYPTSIFYCLGDDYQTGAISNTETSKDIQYVGQSSFNPSLYKQIDSTTYTYSYRFKDEQIRMITQLIRTYMDEGLQDYQIEPLISKYLKHSDIPDDFKVNDVIIDNTKVMQKDKHNAIICNRTKDFYKYRILKEIPIDNKQYNRGAVVIRDQPLPKSSSYEECYAFTCQSLQGQTIEDPARVYINPNRLFTRGLLYTAISRCQSIDQIHILPYEFYTQRKEDVTD